MSTSASYCWNKVFGKRMKLGPRILLGPTIRSDSGTRWASVCILMHSYVSVTHPYAPICLIYASEDLYATHNSQTNINKSNNNHNRQILIAIRRVKSVRIQPDIPNWLNKNRATNTIAFCRNTIVYYICRIRCIGPEYATGIWGPT